MGDVAVAALLEAIDQFAQRSAEHSAGRAAGGTAGEQPAEPAAQQIAETAGARAAGIAWVGAARLAAAEDITQPAAAPAVAALIGAIGEHAEQQHGERRHAASALRASPKNLIQQPHGGLLRLEGNQG